MPSERFAYRASLQGSKFSLTLFGSELLNTYQGGDHYYETDYSVAHFEGVGRIDDIDVHWTRVNFTFWAPRSRLNHKDQGLDHAIFGFQGIEHYRELALDMVSPSRHTKVLDWLIERILAELDNKGNEEQVHLGCIPYDEFVTAFCLGPAPA